MLEVPFSFNQASMLYSEKKNLQFLIRRFCTHLTQSMLEFNLAIRTWSGSWLCLFLHNAAGGTSEQYSSFTVHS